MAEEDVIISPTLGFRTPEANTAVVDTSGLNDNWLKSQALGLELQQYRDQQADKQMRQRAMEAAKLDIEGIRPVDADILMKGNQDLLKWVSQDPKRYGTPEYQQKYQAQLDNITYSKAINAYLKQQQQYANDAGYDTPDNINGINQAYNTPLDKFSYKGLQAPNQYSPIASAQTGIEKFKDVIYKTKTSERSLANGQTEKVTTSEVSPQGLNAFINGQLEGSNGYDIRYSLKLKQDAIKSVPDELRTQIDTPQPIWEVDTNGNRSIKEYVKWSNMTPQDYVNATQFPLLFKEKSKDQTLEGSNYQAAASNRASGTGTNWDWLTKYIDDTKNNRIGTSTKLPNGSQGQFVDAPKDFFIGSNANNKQQVVGFIQNPADKQWYMVMKKNMKNGVVDAGVYNRDNLITDWDAQIKVPYVNQHTNLKNQNEVSDYGNTPTTNNDPLGIF